MAVASIKIDFKKEIDMRKSSYQNKLPKSDMKERYEGMNLNVGKPVFEGVYMCW